MKIKAKYILILLLCITHVSCDNYMELLPPSGLVRDQFWNTKEEVKQVVMGAYTTFAQLDEYLFRYGEIRADMVTFLENASPDDQKVIEGNIYPNNSLCNWFQFYEVINFCNEVIKNAPLVQKKDKTFTDFQLKGYLSEVYFLRSLSYFYLVRIFKDVPYITQPSESDDGNFFIPKTDGDTILNYVVKDLEEYRKYATIDGYVSLMENKGRVTKGAYDALLADIYLWLFDYEKCISHIENIEALNIYELLPDDKWFENFYPNEADSYLESIFEFKYSTVLNQPNNTYDLTAQFSYKYCPSKKAIDLFKKEADNPETKRGEKNSIKRNGEGDYSIWKYIGRASDGITTRSGIDQNDCSWIVYRLADVLLMKAEALSQIGNFKDALDIINLIRKRAGFASPLALENNVTVFEDQIMMERTLELAFEGKRWFDLLRMGRRNNFARKGKIIEIIVSNASSTQKRILSTKLTNPFGWYLPIHKEEIERNKNLVQNPYYYTNF